MKKETKILLTTEENKMGFGFNMENELQIYGDGNGYLVFEEFNG